MILYNKYVNYSIFDGEITIEKEAREYLISTVFQNSDSSKDIKLIINGISYSARLMYVESSHSVQISYKTDVQEIFKNIFQYSYDYWITFREMAKKQDHSTRKIHTQTVETISISDTTEPFVYLVSCQSHFNSDNPYDRNKLESEESIMFPEGKKLYITHTVYERNQGVVKYAKEKFKEKYGSLYCEVCGFSFDIYGERGKDFIEAHHDVPVSQLGDNATSNINDIKMVCSNCHKVLHLKRPWLKVSELKALLNL